MYDRRKVDAADSMMFLVGFNKIKGEKCKDTTQFDFFFVFFNHALLVFDFFIQPPLPPNEFYLFFLVILLIMPTPCRLYDVFGILLIMPPTPPTHTHTSKFLASSLHVLFHH